MAGEGDPPRAVDSTTESESSPAVDRGFDLGARLADRERRGLRRDLQPVERVAARTRVADDPGGDVPEFDHGELLVFAANDYLGLASDERVRRAAAAAASDVGTGAGASRLVTGDTPVHRALERDLADAKGTERALAFSSGYATNVGVLGALSPDVIFSDELNHASIVDGCRYSGAETVVYDHCDVADLRDRMARRAGDRSDDAGGASSGGANGDDPSDGGDDATSGAVAADESWLVVTDSVFSVDGDVAPLSALCDLAEAYGAWLMVDEAHATGLYGDGGGRLQREGLADRVHVQMGTLSKALAAQGGYVAGSEPLVEYLANAARSFVFSTGLAPPAAAAAREALAVARQGDRPAALWATVQRLRDGLEAAGFDVRGDTQILPVVVGDRADAMALADRLRDRGVLAPAIRPPTVPEETSRVRVAPMATHTDDEVDRCVDAFRAAGRELELI